MATPVATSKKGSGLLEAVVAAGILATALTGILPLVLVAVSGAAQARTDLMAATLAQERLAQLQTLQYLHTGVIVIGDGSTLPRGDGFVDGGRGLTATGLGALETPQPASSEWLDERGTWLADGSAAAPPRAVYQRRWGVLAGPGTACLQLWVEVRTTVRLASSAASAGAVHCPWGLVP
jgi:type II secretory pathway pseudopilin PulG